MLSWINHRSSTSQNRTCTVTPSHLTNHPSKTNKTHGARLEKLISYELLLMDMPVFADQQRFTYIISVRIQNSQKQWIRGMDGVRERQRERERERENQGALCYQRDLMMMMMMIHLSIYLSHLFISRSFLLAFSFSFSFSESQSVHLSIPFFLFFVFSFSPSLSLYLPYYPIPMLVKQKLHKLKVNSWFT